jgi:hypothetical protein
LTTQDERTLRNDPLKQPHIVGREFSLAELAIFAKEHNLTHEFSGRDLYGHGFPCEYLALSNGENFRWTKHTDRGPIYTTTQLCLVLDCRLRNNDWLKNLLYQNLYSEKMNWNAEEDRLQSKPHE